MYPHLQRFFTAYRWGNVIFTKQSQMFPLIAKQRSSCAANHRSNIQWDNPSNDASAVWSFADCSWERETLQWLPYHHAKILSHGRISTFSHFRWTSCYSKTQVCNVNNNYFFKNILCPKLSFILIYIKTYCYVGHYLVTNSFIRASLHGAWHFSS